MRYCIYIVAFILLCVPARAQTDSCNSSLSGRIIDEHDKSALSYASVYIVEAKRTAISDENGNYSIKNICNGTYTIKISHLGCETIEVKLTIKGDVSKNFYPEHHAEELKDANIYAKKLADKTTQTTDSLTKKEMDESKGKSLGNALKGITGVNTLQTGASVSKPVIHGMHSNRILILSNGVRLEGQQWGNEHAPELDPFIADHLSVVKGASGVRYGSGAMAGVILVEPKPLRDSAGIGGELNLVGFSNGMQGVGSGMIEGNFGRKLSPLSWRIQGTWKQGGNYQAPEYYLKNTGLKENNFTYALQWKKPKYGADVFYSQFNTELGIFSGSHIGNLTDLYNAFNSPRPLDSAGFSYDIEAPYQKIGHELVKGNFYFRTGELGRLSLTYARQYNLRSEFDEHGSGDSLEEDLPELQFEITTHSGDIVWEHGRIRSLVGTIGLSGMAQGNTHEGRYFIPNFRDHSGGIFWIEKLKKNKYELELGLRYDYKRLQVFKYEKSGSGYILTSPVREFQNASGTAGFIYKPDSVWNLTYNFGTAWRAPHVNELYSEGLHHGAASLEYGDISLIPENAFNNILSLRYSPGKKLRAEFTGYYNYITNFIYLKPALPPVLTIQGAFPTFNYRQADAVFRGIDAAFSYKPVSRFEISMRGSLLRAWNRSDKEWLPLTPSDRCEAELSYYLKDKKRYSDAYISVSGLFADRQWRVQANSDYVPPPSEYFLLGLESGITLNFKKQAISLGLGIHNILNTAYRDYMDRFRYFTDAMGRNISVRIKVPFNTSFKSKAK